MKHSIFCWLLCSLVLASCNRYYMPVTTRDVNNESIKKYIDENRRLILREPSGEFEMRNVRLDEQSNEIYCDLQKVSGLRKVHGPRGRNYYYQPARPDSVVANQVHLLTGRIFAKDATMSAVVPVSAINIIEELKFDKGKTSRHNLGIALGVTAGVATVVGLIATLSEINDLAEWGD